MTDTRVILIGDTGWASLLPALERTGTYKMLGYLKRWWEGVAFFHADGHRYRVAAVSPAREPGPLARLLCYVVYNPFIAISYEYERIAPYQLRELQAALSQAIEHDDDILTQFHERKELLSLVARASTFDEIVSVLELAAGEGAG